MNFLEYTNGVDWHNIDVYVIAIGICLSIKHTFNHFPYDFRHRWTWPSTVITHHPVNPATCLSVCLSYMFLFCIVFFNHMVVVSDLYIPTIYNNVQASWTNTDMRLYRKKQVLYKIAVLITDGITIYYEVERCNTMNRIIQSCNIVQTSWPDYFFVRCKMSLHNQRIFYSLEKLLDE